MVVLWQALREVWYFWHVSVLLLQPHRNASMITTDDRNNKQCSASVFITALFFIVLMSINIKELPNLQDNTIYMDPHMKIYSNGLISLISYCVGISITSLI